ncbi:MAG: asparagine synthase (glutamine-hydrolyzing) [Alphaproteobacteria bacterium]|nr:asparagine synthase (glutamine-hydrolyzing) [Alphaproteobacteria bacterium]
MCGIAGIMYMPGRAHEAGLLDAFAKALAHRGPDGVGRYERGNVALVQTRLAIIDLETGDQPLYDVQGTALIANGEFYEYIELRDAMAEIAFKTYSDCEPPLYLYREHGLAFADDLRGMYAVAIWDPGQDRLVLARDPFGIKPLYYMEGDGFFAFASEPQALMAAGLADPAVEPSARDALLQLQYTTGADTIYRGVKRLLPGETVAVSGARIVERRQRSALPRNEPRLCTENEAMHELGLALANSVEMHQRSDVPYGMFLSGGIDSTAVLSLMAELGDRPVQTFTAGFTGTAVADERAQARIVARRLGAENTEVTFDETDFWALLPRIAAAMDDPAGDYAILPTYKLAAKAKEHGLKVILSGEGGDEILAGYGRYRRAIRPWWRGGRSTRPRGFFDGLGVLRHDLSGWRDAVATAQLAEQVGGRTRLQVAQAVDCVDWLPNDLLTKLDRCLMAHGVEGRVPFLDPKVAQAAFCLPDDMKVRKGMGKWILRRWLDERLPEANAFAKKKGFTVPVAEWILARGRDLGPLVARQPGIDEICDPDAVVGIFTRANKRAGLAAWMLLFYALWHNKHIRGGDIDGGVFDVLAEA